jgi:hypothetical protein
MQRLVIIIGFIFVWSCGQYQKGNKYSSVIPGDSLPYIIAAKGPGSRLSEKAAEMKVQHEYKGNLCQIRYLSDSALFGDQKGIMLLNSMLPEMEKDMLSKGYLGTFTSRQTVTYILVAYEDFHKFFKEEE